MYYENPLELHKLTNKSLFSKSFILQKLDIHRSNKEIVMFVCMTTYTKINIPFIKTLSKLIALQKIKIKHKQSYLIINLYGIEFTKSKLTQIISISESIFKKNNVLSNLIIK